MNIRITFLFSIFMFVYVCLIPGMCMDWELETYNVLGDHKQGRVGLCFISNFKNGNISSREHILVTFQEIVMLLRP